VKEITCCFTGHRTIPMGQLNYVKNLLNRTVEELIAKGYSVFAAGGALGFDTMAAQCVLNLKFKYPRIKLLLILPCLEQTKGWSEYDISVYEDIKNKADEVIYTSLNYTKGCMFKRNRALVDKSSVCIAYLTKKTGGTAYTAKYAVEKGLQLINLGR